ncbi:MAG TPA: GTPase domain-containing protein [Thermodesulfovibrionales bacterium]|nr:GTPase domain-containing protein [Thermodesulfovibrionales bacterium]
MAFFNYVTKEITLKVVYYGPGLSGKTTNLQHLYSVLDPASRGKFISLATEADRTLFFDFLPVDLGKIREFTLRFQLYTVPGQIRYNATRKLVLKGADAIIFVADSQREMREQNLESLENMKENLVANNIDPDSIPMVIQYNKRDLPNVLPLEELERDLNKRHFEFTEAEAVKGKGVMETFRVITKTLVKDIARKHKVDIAPAKDEGIAIRIHEKSELDVEEAIPLQEPETFTEEVATASLPVASQGSFFPDEKLNSLAESLDEINRTLSKMKDSLAFLSSEVIETRKQQDGIHKALNEINRSLSKFRPKRRWFFFL